MTPKPKATTPAKPVDLSPFLVMGAVVAAFTGIAFLIRRREIAGIRSGFQMQGSEDAHLVSGELVKGTIDGFAIRYEIFPGGKHSPGATIVTTPAPEQAAQLEMHLRPQGASDFRAVAKGLEVDLTVGDAAFDARVVVEAAPSAVAIKMLDPITRNLVMRHMPFQFDIADRVIRFHKTGKVTDPAQVSDLLDGFVRIAKRFGELHFEGGGEASAEIAQLRAVRRVRAHRSKMAGVAMIVVAVGLILLFAVMKSK